MKDLNQLVKEYQKTKDNKIIDDIFKEIIHNLNIKADYVYYQKKYMLKDKCIRLKNTGIISRDDVFQELCLDVLKLIQNCDNDKPFINYYYGTLKYWKPKFINNDLYYQLTTTCQLTCDSETSLMLERGKTDPIITDEELYEELTDEQNKIVTLLYANPNLNQVDLARELKISQSAISLQLNEIRKKIKKS